MFSFNTKSVSTLLTGSLLISSLLISNTSQAAYLTETHLDNSSFANAQFIDDIYFTDGFDADINDDYNNNISLTSRHASILGAGDETVDYYSFYLPTDAMVYLDIDYAADFGGYLDSWVELYDANESLININDDSDYYDSGTYEIYDSFLAEPLTSGLYYIAVGSYDKLSPVPFGANYTLHISTQFSAVPVPAAAWLLASGALALFGHSRKRKTA